MKKRLMHSSRFALTLLVLALSGCGSTEPAIPPTPLKDIVNPSVVITEHWERDIGKGSDYAGAAFEPAVADGIVYVASFGGGVTSLDLDAGSRVWKVELEQTLRSGVAVDNQSVYVASRDGQVIALDRENGVERWRTSLNREILEPPVVAGGHVLARAGNGDLISLDVVTGEQLWRHSSIVPDLSVRGSASPQWVQGGYLVPLDDGRLVALDQRNGRTVWEATISEPRGSSPVERIVDVDTQPVILDETVVVGSRRGDLVAVDGQTGEVLWRRKLTAVSSLAAAREQIYVVEQSGEISAVSAEYGSAEWRLESLRGRRLTAPVVLGRHLIVGDLGGYLHWIDLNSGEIVARKRLSNDAIFAKPQISGDNLVVLDQKGRLARLTAAVK